MHKCMRIHQRVLQVVACAVVSWCVAPRATVAEAQCEMIDPGPKEVGCASTKWTNSEHRDLDIARGRAEAGER